MSLSLLPLPAYASRLSPVDPRHAALFCLALLAASCALASFALACATPFAAFAVIAAAMLPLRSALLVITGAWLVNQGIGFGALHYPIDSSTIIWGLVIGIAALAATVAAAAILRLQGRTAVLLALALLCGYAAYELALFAATPFLGGAENFTAAIVARIGLTNAAWLIGLIAVCEIARMVTAASESRARA